MQGQRSTVHSFLEAFEFDNGSSSSSEQQIYWNNMTNPGDSRNFRDYLLSSTDHMNLQYIDAAAHSGNSLNSRTLGGINVGQQSLNHPGHNDVKMDEDWSSSLTIHSGSGPPFDQRRLEQSEIPPLGSININLHNHLPTVPLDRQNSHSTGTFQNSENLAGYVGADIEPLIDGSSDSNQYKPLASVTGQMLSAGCSSDPGGSSSGMIGDNLDDNGSRSGCSMDGRRLSCKRKNLEMVSGQSSLNESSSFQRVEENIRHVLPPRHNGSLNISAPPQNPSSVRSFEEQLNPSVGGTSHSSLPVGNDTESSQRSFRMRMNPTYPQESTPSHIWAAANSMRRNVWQPHSSTGRAFPSNRSIDLRSLIAGTSSPHNQSNVPHLPGFHQYLQTMGWNGASNPRIGTSSSSHVTSGDRSTDLREDGSSRTLPGNISEHLVLPPPLDTRHYSQDPAPWSQSSGNLPADTSSTSLVGSSSGPSGSGAGWTTSSVAFANLPRRLSEGRRSLLPSSVSDSGAQIGTFPPPRSVPAASSASEMVLPSSAGPQRHSHHYLRSAFLMDRPGDGILGVPLSLRNLQAANEGRIRLVSEIRNALDLIRRGESLRFEDVLILDQSVFYGGADLHDRHRDMRLDVDNMSYEELLALEERIGNVSTGLSEETIMKCLKQAKYGSPSNQPSMDVEPCCICQEEYVDEDYLGTLDCGHNFHTVCIKQWLMHKNLCPICKTTALVTT